MDTLRQPGLMLVSLSIYYGGRDQIRELMLWNRNVSSSSVLFGFVIDFVLSVSHFHTSLTWN